MKYNLKHYAYIGDAVWEIFIRKLVINKVERQELMHKLSTKYVCASKQAEIMNNIMDYLKEDELDIQKRGRNLKITINKRNNPALHALATSFETLIGYLYLNDRERLDEILKIILASLDDFSGISI